MISFGFLPRLMLTNSDSESLSSFTEISIFDVLLLVEYCLSIGGTFTAFILLLSLTLLGVDIYGFISFSRLWLRNFSFSLFKSSMVSINFLISLSFFLSSNFFICVCKFGGYSTCYMLASLSKEGPLRFIWQI